MVGEQRGLRSPVHQAPHCRSGASHSSCSLSLLLLRPQVELLDLYTVNLHRIEKDVQRCDRNYWYFTPANLEKLRNIMCRYLVLGIGGGAGEGPGRRS